MHPTGIRDESLAPQELVMERATTRAHYWASNPEGKNQFPNCPPKDSNKFLDLLRQYHRITTNRTEVKALLAREHSIETSERTISRRWKEMGLKGSKATEASLPPGKILQLVVDHMAEDPAGRAGRSELKRKIALRSGVHLKRQTVANIQKMIDPEGVVARTRHPPSRRQIRRVSLSSEGPNDAWCCDGHDKLCKYGFAIWGIRDKFSRKWLGLWVIPKDHLSSVVSYLWLSLVHRMEGIPKQSSPDCEWENGMIDGLATTLKNAFCGNDDDKPARIFLRGVQQIPIERGWLDLRKELGHNLSHFWEAGTGIYRENDITHQHLARWLWPPLLQRELDKFSDEANNKRMRKQKSKVPPSGVSPNIAYTFPERFGGVPCLQPVDLGVVKEMLDDMQAEMNLLSDWGVPEEFKVRAQHALEILRVKEPEITLQNVWLVFSALLAHL